MAASQYSYTERKRIRKSFGSRENVLAIPYLLQMQKDAYTAFLQADVPPTRRTAAFASCPRRTNHACKYSSRRNPEHRHQDPRH